jgi:hypothetical protein
VVEREKQHRAKDLHVTSERDKVPSALAQLSARGLFLEVWCKTESHARALLKNAEKWSRDR